MVIPSDGITGTFENASSARSYWGDLMSMANMTGALKHEAAAACLLLPPAATDLSENEEKILTSCPPNTSSSPSHHHVALIQVPLIRLLTLFSLLV
jgi:adiponectin receptor